MQDTFKLSLGRTKSNKISTGDFQTMIIINASNIPLKVCLGGTMAKPASKTVFAGLTKEFALSRFEMVHIEYDAIDE